MAARRKRPSRSRVAALSHKLQDLLREAQMRQKVPAGMAQCPLCGLLVQPMRIAKLRTHDDPLSGTRCAASGRLWAEFGKRAPKVPKAQKVAARAAKPKSRSKPKASPAPRRTPAGRRKR